MTKKKLTEYIELAISQLDKNVMLRLTEDERRGYYLAYCNASCLIPGHVCQEDILEILRTHKT
jgi:hypothetical protein